MRCAPKNVRRSVILRPGDQSSQPTPPVGTAFVGAPIWYPARLTAADVAPPVSPAWTASAPLFGRALLSQRRIPGDTSSIINATPVPIAAGTAVVEWQNVGDPMPAGITIGGRVVYIGRNGAVIGAALLPVACLRVWDVTGTVLRAELLPAASWGTSAMASNTTRLIISPAAATAAPYVTQAGDRLVLETGAFNSGVDPGDFQWSYGTLVGTVINNDYQLHVAAQAAEGVNPGSRVAYLEIDGWSA